MNQESVSFPDKVIAILPKIYMDEELMQMAFNFIAEQSPNLFLDPKTIRNIEECIEIREKAGKKLLLSFEYPDPKRFPLREGCSYGVDFLYLGRDFSLFVKLLQTRVNIPNENEGFYLAHLYLLQMAVLYFSNEWEKEHHSEFLDISNLELPSAIQRYISIDSINHRDDRTLGAFFCYLMYHKKFDQENFLICHDIFTNQLNLLLTQREEDDRFNSFMKRIKQSNVISPIKTYTIDEVDLMTGQEFEQLIAIIFTKMGYETIITKASGDQGIDIIAIKNGYRIGIQAKCYSGSVGNKAVQESVAGRNYYRLDKVIVVTNNFFTESAKKLAMTNLVVLWDRNILKEKM